MIPNTVKDYSRFLGLLPLCTASQAHALCACAQPRVTFAKLAHMRDCMETPLYAKPNRSQEWLLQKLRLRIEKDYVRVTSAALCAMLDSMHKEPHEHYRYALGLIFEENNFLQLRKEQVQSLCSIFSAHLGVDFRYQTFLRLIQDSGYNPYAYDVREALELAFAKLYGVAVTSPFSYPLELILAKHFYFLAIHNRRHPYGERFLRHLGAWLKHEPRSRYEEIAEGLGLSTLDLLEIIRDNYRPPEFYRPERPPVDNSTVPRESLRVRVVATTNEYGGLF